MLWLRQLSAFSHMEGVKRCFALTRCGNMFALPEVWAESGEAEMRRTRRDLMFSFLVYASAFLAIVSRSNGALGKQLLAWRHCIVFKNFSWILVYCINVIDIVLSRPWRHSCRDMSGDWSFRGSPGLPRESVRAIAQVRFRRIVLPFERRRLPPLHETRKWLLHPALTRFQIAAIAVVAGWRNLSSYLILSWNNYLVLAIRCMYT